MKTVKIFLLTVIALSLSFASGNSSALEHLKDKINQPHTIDTAAQADERRLLYHIINDTGKTDSDSAQLIVNAPPQIKKHPDSQRITSGSVVIAKLKKKPAPVFSNLNISAPPGQGQYVQNGNILTLKGATIPNARVTSAYLKNEKGYIIRDVSKIVTIDPATGNLNGSFFVGSFRGAHSVRLNITIYDPSDKKTVKETSNTITVDNSDPKIAVTEPMNHAYFKTAPIKITGTASDKISGIAGIEISVDGGASYIPVSSFSNGQWQYLFTPYNNQTLYKIQARTTDRVGHCTVSDSRVIHCRLPQRAVKKVNQVEKVSKKENFPILKYRKKNTDKSPDEDGICTYRIISLNNNRFQPSDLFTLNEEMAIIVRGYGGKMITIKIIDPSNGKTVFELSDYIPANKNKMWKWKLSKTGIFRAELLVDGSQKDDVFFKIIQ